MPRLLTRFLAGIMSSLSLPESSALTPTMATMTTPKLVPIPARGVDYRQKVVLAPMVRSGELPSRLLALHYGADLVWGPETVDKSMIGTTRKFNAAAQTIDFTRMSSDMARLPEEQRRESTLYRIHPEKEGKKLIFQIGTANPETAVACAKLVAGDVVGIDVNAGCPKPFSTTGGMGAALLKTPDKLVAILEALVKEVGAVYEIGISVKIRILDTAEETAALVKRLVATGITGLTVHCRTTPMRPRERAIRDQLRMIGDICREAGVACLMNGDVTSRDEALALAAEYNVNGAMIATAAESNSSVFLPKSSGGPLPWKEVIKEYIDLALQVENKWGNTKFLIAQLLPGKAEEAKRCQKAHGYSDVVEIMGWTEWYDRAREVDEKLGRIKEGVKVKEKGIKNKTAIAAGGGVGKGRREDGKKRPLSQRGIESFPAMAV